MSDNVLNINELIFGHKIPLVSEAVSLNADAGDLICFVGRNGTGKTTMLNTLIGILKPFSGEINICGTPVNNISAREKSRFISFVPSKIENVMNMSVRDLVAIGRTPYTNIFDKRKNIDNQLIDDFIEKFGLSKISLSSISEISDGERQKAMICRALVQQTPVILLDEPTAFLDYFAKRKLLSELKKVAMEEGKCIIFSCHDLEIAVQFCTKVWLLDEMKIKSLSSQEFLNGDYLQKYQ